MLVKLIQGRFESQKNAASALAMYVLQPKRSKVTPSSYLTASHKIRFMMGGKGGGGGKFDTVKTHKSILCNDVSALNLVTCICLIFFCCEKC